MVEYYKKLEGRCKLVQCLANGYVDHIASRVSVGDYTPRDLIEVLAMVEKDGVLDVAEIRAAAVRVVDITIRQLKEKAVQHAARERAAMRLLEEEFEPILAELQGEHGGIL